MATKWKNDLWSVAAIAVAAVCLIYCSSFILDFVIKSPEDLLATLRHLTKGDT
ncbi:hypothetical protein KQ939_01695 [Planococcus sp. CP5-4]|uniref:hypothetical protein n=1 Tax=unclassified Planococcus (in: firmicutes) TaxID=2662419 RepID=UPI001C23AC4F|nr:MULTISPECIES: hypothetical protein [unclassified Planococcus (in: firmicutes)]MBU9673110.1 hypothetical protein [Planococcus sp. CP5-4_YE]MBV0908356.1 hypothetical protein [Planococcus sp. CP5-4_UN]MBW6062418.1 hypothetical protein [Planococcus sp. CP5-4]